MLSVNEFQTELNFIQKFFSTSTECNQQKYYKHFSILFNWDSLQARLKSYYEAWSFKKKRKKKMKGKQQKLFTKKLKRKGVY